MNRFFREIFGRLNSLLVRLGAGAVMSKQRIGDPIKIGEQGSYAVGGIVKTSPGNFDPVEHGALNPVNQSTQGQTLHGDHAFVFFQKPVNARKFPLVFWHGIGQSMKTWQTTPDGREGFQNIFLRHRYPVYLLDQPRRGLAGRSTEPTTITAATDDQLCFGIFRLGMGAEFYPDVQFSKDPKALDQFFRQTTPDTGPLDIDINIAAVLALFDQIGQGILVTALAMARKWRDAVNKHGGDVTLVQFPEIGLKGNTHFPMSDLNNLEVADHLLNWLKDKGLAD